MEMVISPRRLLVFLSLTVAVAAGAAQQPSLLQIDARDVAHGIQKAKLRLPVHPGPLTLAYPKWIPGEHAADGPLTQMMSLQIMGGAKPIPWRRDSLDPFLFHLNVPPGVTELDIRFDYVSPAKSFGDGYGKTPNSTPHLLILPFNHFILYPADAVADAVRLKAEVLIPEGWKFDGALKPERLDGARIFLPETSLYTLVDSPLLA